MARFTLVWAEYVYALEAADGAKIWNYTTDGAIETFILTDDVVYAISLQDALTFYALGNTASVVPTKPSPTPTPTPSPSVSESPQPSPTLQPSFEPSPTPNGTQLENLIPALVLIVVVAVAAVAVGALVILRRRR